MKTLEQVIEEFLVSTDEAAAIAEAVRGWMREPNEGLRGVIFDILLEELPPQSVSHADADSCVDAILSVIPPRRAQSAPDRDRIKELEAEVARLKDATQEGASLETLRTQRDKAAKYDSLCEQFPYMPGAVVWILQDGAIQRATVWRIGERVARVLLDEIAIDVDPSRLHHTADACRAAIPVEE